MRAQGASTAEACRRIAVSEQTYYRWRKEYGGLKTAEARCMRLARECQALIVVRQLRHEDVLAALAELFVTRGPPAHIRSDNGAEVIANAVECRGHHETALRIAQTAWVPLDLYRTSCRGKTGLADGVTS